MYWSSSVARVGNLCTTINIYVLKAVVQSWISVRTCGFRGVKEIPEAETVKLRLSEPWVDWLRFFGKSLDNSKNSPLSMSRMNFAGISGVKPPSAMVDDVGFVAGSTGRSAEDVRKGNDCPSCSNRSRGLTSRPEARLTTFGVSRDGRASKIGLSTATEGFTTSLRGRDWSWK